MKQIHFLIITSVLLIVAVRFREAIRVNAELALANALNYPAINMQISNQGIEEIKRREGGFQAFSYPDAHGRSIGFGHFIQAGESFQEPISEQEATELLRADIQLAESAVRGNVKVTITQAMYDALVSFTYNVGTGAFRNSTLLRKLNAQDYAGAAEEFARWNKSQGQVIAALNIRRSQEIAQFKSGGLLA